jgi:MFS family permease
MTVEGTAERETASAPTGARHWFVLAVVSVAQLMAVLDVSVVNIALPSAQADLGFGDSARQWVITAYALAFGSLLLLGGRVGDLSGRRRVFLVSLVAFALASALGGAAPSLAVLVLARAVQGAAAAMLVPAALGTLITTYSGESERGKAFAVFGAVSMGGGAVGLILGGVLTEYLSWRWCMYVNVVFGAAAFFGALACLPDVKSAVRARIDLVGAALASLGLLGLVFGFSRAETDGWTSGATIGSLALGAVLLVSFVLAEQRVTQPLLPLRVVTDRSRATAFATVGIAGTATFGLFLFLTYYLQLVKGFSPLKSGLGFVPDDRLYRGERDYRECRDVAALRSACGHHCWHDAGFPRPRVSLAAGHPLFLRRGRAARVDHGRPWQWVSHCPLDEHRDRRRAAAGLRRCISAGQCDAAGRRLDRHCRHERDRRVGNQFLRVLPPASAGFQPRRCHPRLRGRVSCDGAGVRRWRPARRRVLPLESAAERAP